MRTTTPLALAFGLALAATLPAQAQQKMSPGLWETTMNVKSDGQDMSAQMAQMKAEMAKMPPEQRKMMEEMMAKQGVSMGGGAGGGMAFKYCLSKEQAERGEPPADKDGRCKRDSMDRSGNTIKFKFTCTNPPSTGTGEITIASDKAYAMKMVVDQQGGAKGGPRQMEMQQNAKWLGSDCGTLRPVGEAAKAGAKP
jgi:hypothetical protein